jgi:hypothetical protein
MPVRLDPVPETLLWTLWHRAVEARRPDAVLVDPLAVELVERIDFPFAARFGNGERLSQWQALRARCFDDAIRRFLADHPSGTVAALGEGLEPRWLVERSRRGGLRTETGYVAARLVLGARPRRGAAAAPTPARCGARRAPPAPRAGSSTARCCRSRHAPRRCGVSCSPCSRRASHSGDERRVLRVGLPNH